MTIADLIVARLSAAGVRFLFGMPGGGSNLDVIDAAGRAGLPFVLSHTETAAAIMAIAQSEVTLSPGACLATLGPGVASLVNGVACAYLDRAPLIVITDTYPRAAAECSHQKLDHQELLRTVTKWTARIEPDSAGAIMSCALAAATEDPPGPVHLDLPADVSTAGVAAPARTVARPSGRVTRGDRDPRRAIRAARRPLLVVGLGARREPDISIVRAVCDRGVPALVTYKAKGVVPDEHPAFAGVFTNGIVERSIVDQADFLIGVGLDPVEVLPRPWTAAAPIVYCGRWSVPGSHVPFAAQLIGDLATTEEWLPRRTEWDLDAVRRTVSANQALVRTETAGLSPSAIVDAVLSSVGGGVRVTVDAGAHMLPVMLLWPVARPNDLLISNGLSTMGFALPAAIGAALVDPQRPVVAFTGDAGLLMCLAELRTAARERLNVRVVVFDDERLSLIDVKQRQRGYREAGVAMGRVDWAEIGRGFGVPAFAVDDERGLARAVREAANIEGPALIAAKTDASAYDAIVKAVRG